jgi:hypothetical protein
MIKEQLILWRNALKSIYLKIVDFNFKISAGLTQAVMKQEIIFSTKKFSFSTV